MPGGQATVTVFPDPESDGLASSVVAWFGNPVAQSA